MVTSSIQLFQILRERLGESEAASLVEFVDSKIKEQSDVNAKLSATKEDLAHAKTDIIKWIVGLFIPLYLTIIGLAVTLIKFKAP